jgi:hypothetical protein
MAYAEGVLYVPVVNLSTDFTPSSIIGFGDFSKGTGELVAIEIATGKILWDKQFTSMNFGGATVVNDLVLTATFDGTIYAFKRATGEQVWSYQAPVGINAWPAVAGDTIIWPAGAGSEPSLIAFRLNAKTPIINIRSPMDGASLAAGDMPVSVEVFNFNVVDKLGQPNVPGDGHVHYYLDAEPPTTKGQPAITAPGTYVAMGETSYTWTNVAPGTHTLAVQLVNNDHTPLTPPVVDKVTIIVTPPGQGGP